MHVDPLQSPQECTSFFVQSLGQVSTHSRLSRLAPPLARYRQLVAHECTGRVSETGRPPQLELQGPLHYFKSRRGTLQRAGDEIILDT